MKKEIMFCISLVFCIYLMFDPPFFLTVVERHAGIIPAQIILLAVLRKRAVVFLKKNGISMMLILGMTMSLSAQPYIDGNKRYSFAQSVFGLEMQYIPAGIESTIISPANGLMNYETDPILNPRINISGLHFWGHAEFYLSIPFGNLLDNEKSDIQYSYSNNVETGLKYYPWRIEAGKIRPYLGLSMNLTSFRQKIKDGMTGPLLNKMRTPIQFGLTYNRKNSLFELGLSYYHHNQDLYPISRTEFADLKTAPLAINLAYKFYLDTTIGASKGTENGFFEQKTKAMAAAKQLDGFSFAIGVSSIFFVKESEYNQSERPFLGDYKAGDVFLEYGLGYYFHRADAHVNLSFRTNNATLNAYGVRQQIKRNALTLEAYKFLGDYHGFVPFIGPALSYEQLTVKETDNGNLIIDEQKYKWAGGITFGWDIRPTRLSSWYLRTNLRYFPALNLKTESGKKLSLDNIEFNFIQFVYYPGRAKRINNWKG